MKFGVKIKNILTKKQKHDIMVTEKKRKNKNESNTL